MTKLFKCRYYNRAAVINPLKYITIRGREEEEEDIISYISLQRTRLSARPLARAHSVEGSLLTASFVAVFTEIASRL